MPTQKACRLPAWATASHRRHAATPRRQHLIRGRFDPARWAADPNRRTDVYDEDASTAPPGDTITGLAGAPGVVHGVARLIGTIEDAGHLRNGESS